MKYCLLFLLVSFSLASFAQKSKSRNVDDSLLTALLKNIPKDQQKDFKKMYYEMPKDQRSLFALMGPSVSSKRELISNININYNRIWDLKLLFNKLVPANHKIYIELKKPQRVARIGESVDLWYSDNTAADDWLFQEQDVELNSGRLDTLLTQIGWDKNMLNDVLSALKNANCVSIMNGEPTEIGFARSGLGKYSFFLFNNKLTDDQIKKYNNGCQLIYYRDNIVLKYRGASASSPCFPDKS